MVGVTFVYSSLGYDMPLTCRGSGVRTLQSHRKCMYTFRLPFLGRLTSSAGDSACRESCSSAYTRPASYHIDCCLRPGTCQNAHFSEVGSFQKSHVSTPGSQLPLRSKSSLARPNLYGLKRKTCRTGHTFAVIIIHILDCIMQVVTGEPLFATLWRKIWLCHQRLERLLVCTDGTAFTEHTTSYFFGAISCPVVLERDDCSPRGQVDCAVVVGSWTMRNKVLRLSQYASCVLIRA